MNVWDATTWATVLVLGAGALVIFAACVREAWRILREDDAGAAERR
jgi:hypothetical protein